MRAQFLALLVSTLIGCAAPASVICGDGSTCPEGSTCDVERGRCISPEARGACEDRVDGDACVLAGAAGTCTGGACELDACGDGRATGPEACDGADLAGQTCVGLGYYAEGAGLACNAGCRLDTSGCAGACGDGVRDAAAGEACDGADLGGATCQTAGFYDPGAVTCTGLCGLDTSACTGRCGDGVINGPELCDGAPPAESCVAIGYDAGAAGCSALCAADASSCARFGFRVTPVTTQFVDGFHAHDVATQWIVGDDGFAARLQPGGDWEVVPTPVTTSLRAVFAASPQRAWAAGLQPSGGAPLTLLAWDGAAWTAITGGPATQPNAVWGTTTDVVIGTDAGVHAWGPAGWRELGALGQRVAAVAGAGLDDLWAATSLGVYHWDGAAWTLTTAPLGLDAVALAVLGPGDVLALGRLPSNLTVVVRCGTTSWSALSTAPSGTPRTLAASAVNDVWATIGAHYHHFDGISWTTTQRIGVDAGLPIGLVSFAPDEVVGARGDGIAVRFRGQVAYEHEPTGVLAPQASAAWVDRAGRQVVGTTGGLVIRGGGANLIFDAVAASPITALWGTSATDIYAGTQSGDLFHYDGGGWELVLPLANGGPINRIEGSGSDDVWGVAGPRVGRFDGATWATLPALPFFVQDLEVGPWGTWVISGFGDLYRWDGAAWVLEAALPPGGPTVTSLAVTGPSSAYAALDRRYLLAFDGQGWTELDVGAATSLTRVAASAPDDVIAMSATEAFHFDGARWSPLRLDAPTGLAPAQLLVKPNRIDVHYPGAPIRALLRVTPWACRATETGCADGVDDDCDGAIDALDADCP